jgi:hypothetical protein
VLPDHLAVKVAYTQASSVEALRAVGVRIRRVEDLAQLVASLAAGPDAGLTAGPTAGHGPELGSDGSPGMGPLALPDVFRPSRPWAFASKKPPTKQGKTPKWEESWSRFQLGREHVEAIAMTQPGGKPVLVSTVLGHLLQALTLGHPVDLARLAAADPTGVPSRAEWLAFDEAEAAEGVDVTTAEVALKPLARRVVGEAAFDAEPKSDAQRAHEAAWYQKLRWWSHLKAAGWAPA